MVEIGAEQAGLAGVLSKVGLFSGIKGNADAISALAKIMTEKEVAPNTCLIKEDETGEEFYILISGQVSIYKKTLDQDRYRVAILKSDIVPAFGEGGLIQAEPRSATVTCDVASKVLVLAQKDFADFCMKYPHWAVPILQKLALNLMGNLRKANNDLMLLHRALMSEIRS